MNPRQQCAIGAIALCTLAGCASTENATVDGLDFRYDVGEGAQQRPYQVFDDGVSTYFQFREVPPSSMSVSVLGATGEIPQRLDRQAAYVRVPSIAHAFMVRDGEARVRVTYHGPARSDHVVAIPPAPLEAQPSVPQAKSPPCTRRSKLCR
ncbi:TrbG/VirB9 family P-type conjugative transfer protein [Ralstonia sp. 1138]|uniref:TrbG/VirB9 family P-type conjugative transfer protein n=1 Tax=Ralstonia sp. 1138 TaxID=3156423 RepID=UPI00339B400B